MGIRGVFAAATLVVALTTTAQAQNKYDVFVGQYAAASHIARSCPGISTVDEQRAGDMAKAQNKLRKQKVLRFLYYGQSSWLNAQGNMALRARDVDPDTSAQLCRFGRKVAGSTDAIGRFLHSK